MTDSMNAPARTFLWANRANVPVSFANYRGYKDVSKRGKCLTPPVAKLHMGGLCSLFASRISWQIFGYVVGGMMTDSALGCTIQATLRAGD